MDFCIYNYSDISLYFSFLVAHFSGSGIKVMLTSWKKLGGFVFNLVVLNNLKRVGIFLKAWWNLAVMPVGTEKFLS